MNGRAVLAEMATGFYAGFADLIVRCDDVRIASHHTLFAWTLEGHDASRRIRSSLGRFDDVD